MSRVPSPSPSRSPPTMTSLSVTQTINGSHSFTIKGLPDKSCPPRIWSLNVVEQKNGRPTVSKMDLICLLYVVNICFLEAPPFKASVSRSDSGKTTAGIRPIVRS
ncbi:unnamed protein product [Microthlaspi erraticum]|uniref:Uncharacterized protein n=1 Tax=Microthlaspi erraticum TaxID=1685480 RepID=A0A6D2K706_9BRAS|nr:unnamed protein product [Microthlaspi erraticum]